MAFNLLTHVTCKHVEVLHDHQNLEITNFFLPRTKSAPQGENVNWAKQEGPVDPQEALTNHFLVNNPPDNLHLFAYRAKNSYQPLTRSKFLKVIEITGKKAGVPPLKEHGICIGSTLEYLLRNIPFKTVKVKG